MRATKLPENVPTVVINLDRPRRMAMTLGAMRRLKERTGKSLTAFGEVSDEDGIETLPPLIWAALVNEDREGLSPEDIEEMVHVGNLPAVMESINALVAGLVAEGTEGNESPAPAGKKAKRRS